MNIASRADVTRNYTFRDEKAKLKVGGGYTFKKRDYEINGFSIFTGNTEVTDDPNTIFQSDNFFNRENTEGLYYAPQFIPNNANAFESQVQNIAAYVSNEFTPVDKLKAIVGVRMESYVQNYSGRNQSNQVFDNEEVLNDLDLFPTLNLIYAVKENHNLRASFTRTIARPSFKEASFATIIDPISGRTFIGGFFSDIDVETGEEIWDGNLTKTNINNFDLRYEMYQGGGQNISLSAFYKTFENPIEIVQYVQATNNFQPRNVGNGQVLGVELEFKKSLGSVDSKLNAFSVNGNITVTESSVKMNETERRSRINNARDGEEIGDSRDMAGQAPYIVNAGLSYNGRDNGLELGMFYNVQGRTLQYVGIADRPDVYSVPFQSLNFSANYTFGMDKKFRAGLKVNNILNSARESVFESFNAEDQIFSSIRPQTSIGMSLSYRL